MQRTDAPMNYNFSDSLITAAISALGGAAQWFNDIMHGRTHFSWIRFPMVISIGVFTGYFGAELSKVLGHPEYELIAACICSSSGSYVLGRMGRFARKFEEEKHYEDEI